MIFVSQISRVGLWFPYGTVLGFLMERCPVSSWNGARTAEVGADADLAVTTYDTLTRVRNTGPADEHLYNANT